MNYELGRTQPKINFLPAFNALRQHIRKSRGRIIVAYFLLMVITITTIAAPFIIGDVTNKYIPVGDRDNLLKYILILLGIYAINAVASYFQMRIMGQVGQRILFSIRNAVFQKLQTLPLQFFNQNKSGDLISRINNDTDKMNQTFSETLLRFTGDILVIIGIGIVMVVLNPSLGMIAITALVLMLLVTAALAGWIRYRNDRSLQRLGEMSGGIQESLSNFKVTVVFNRRDYFKSSFAELNQNNQAAATAAGIANTTLAPIYNYAANIGSALILIFGIHILILDKISAGVMPEFGTLLTFILYSSTFFGPLKEMADLFSQLQVAVSSWSRIYSLLRLESNLVQIEDAATDKENLVMKFHNVSFGYLPSGGDAAEQMVLNKINIELEEGKTYALVGPTGGGKTTTASLMVRLYDATEGQVFLRGRDIRSYSPQDLSNEIGFILQEPFLFTGTIAENVKYGNAKIEEYTDEQLKQKLAELGLEKLLERFADGLQTEIKAGAENISLGQRQLISFVRILLREPKLLILDEATANIDTVTEQLLEDILEKLPKTTTKVIIAHRLNTIENADQIFFISGGTIEKPMDFKSALDLINTNKKGS